MSPILGGVPIGSPWKILTLHSRCGPCGPDPIRTGLKGRFRAIQDGGVHGGYRARVIPVINL